MQKKIRTAQKQKVPFMLIAGATDEEAGAVSFRYRDGSQRNGIPVDEAADEISRDHRAPGEPVADRGILCMTEAEPAENFAGDPDGFGRLWTPHRMAYIKGENKPTHDEAGEGCPFCDAPKRSDEDALIFARGEHVYGVLNLYPYNSGHLMIVPYRHVSDYIELDVDETAEFAAFTQRAIRVLQDCDGAARLQHRDEPGQRRRRGDRGAPAPARRPALGRGHQLHADRRADPGAARVAGRGAPR